MSKWRKMKNYLRSVVEVDGSNVQYYLKFDEISRGYHALVKVNGNIKGNDDFDVVEVNGEYFLQYKSTFSSSTFKTFKSSNRLIFENEMYKLVTSDEAALYTKEKNSKPACKNCKFCLWMVAYGLGVKCSNENNKQHGEFYSISNRYHLCKYYEPKILINSK